MHSSEWYRGKRVFWCSLVSPFKYMNTYERTFVLQAGFRYVLSVHTLSLSLSRTDGRSPRIRSACTVRIVVHRSTKSVVDVVVVLIVGHHHAESKSSSCRPFGGVGVGGRRPGLCFEPCGRACEARPYQ